ncbi:AAA-like domain-containing protein [Nostoc sp. 106C]|uniref:AAA-like domain-containing protein n=1 Tax=Nostoc sp. 106C TaxID=1932667 RepID=UPI000A3CDAB8|nr:AAA-like domain-containing protein [Nostoc sp. 106C]OUL35322.1 hypothetical protein BV375_02525 [Nostoc sp. 106C]
MTNYRYQIGGSLAVDAPSYVKRRADVQLYEALKQGEFCYILSSRQMGKSSLLVQTKYRLQQEGFQCKSIDLSIMGSESITPLQWYKGIVGDLWTEFNLIGKINLKSWWNEKADISFVQKLKLFIEELLLIHFPDQRIFIFIDEVDSILNLKFSVDDFFSLIRFCYNQRAINPEYNRITFAIFGVATPSYLIQEPTKTPFNIGKAIELEGFKLDEATPLIGGFQERVERPQIVLKEILAWTGGQPFLTQKLCNVMLKMSQMHPDKEGIIVIPPGTEAFWVENFVKSLIINNWELQDEPEHLRTIRDRLLWNEQLTGRLLSTYQQLLQYTDIHTDDGREQIELLLSGLVVKHQGYLKITNPIYRTIFNLAWVKQQLKNLRPYSQAFDAWMASARTDESRLLRGQALKDAQQWSQDKRLSDLDYQFLAASQELDRQEVEKTLEAARAKEVEARLAIEQKRIIQQRRANRILAFLTTGMTIKFLIFLWLWLSTLSQYRQASINLHQARVGEIEALISSSQGHFAANQPLQALIDSIRAKRSLQKLEAVDANLELEVDRVLQQAVSNPQAIAQLETSQRQSEQISEVEPLAYGCHLLRDYLQTSTEIRESDRHVCDSIK